ncbi:hypothetical protein [Microbacterium sp. PMB16]|uniref:hypothetical protein n=1 Tax=Microbacterium sp. PMB16 TaxID=3120157 RepID=UPI003F4B67E8
MREQWRAYRNGREVLREVDVVMQASVVTVCAHCGVPCSGIYRFWYELDGELMMVDADQPTIDEYMAELVESAGPDGYADLSAMVRAGNEGTGWADSSTHPFGADVGVEGFEDFVSGLRTTSAATWSADLVDALHQLAAMSALHGTTIYAMDD